MQIQETMLQICKYSKYLTLKSHKEHTKKQLFEVQLDSILPEVRLSFFYARYYTCFKLKAYRIGVPFIYNLQETCQKCQVISLIF
jgi:hypothetical protein